MQPRYEIMGRTFLPMFRSLLASQLVEKYNLSEVDVARRLGITQATVSQYLRAKRRREHKERILTRKVDEMAKRVALQMSQNRMSSDDLTRMGCALCAKLVLRRTPFGKG